MKSKLKFPTFTLWVLPHRCGHTFFIQTQYSLVVESVHNLLTYIFHEYAHADFKQGYFLIASNKKAEVYYHVDYEGNPIHFPLGTTVRIIENFQEQLLSHSYEEFRVSR